MIALRGHCSTRGLALAALAILLAGCTADEKIVYRDAPDTTTTTTPPVDSSRILNLTPPATAKGYLGYANSKTRLTVCGTCHVSMQERWVQTRHATAWADLAASGHAAGTCEACHTVGQLGNGNAVADVGWTGSKDVRYYDVQCESCHGAGEPHMKNPGRTNVPLAVANASADPKDPSGCGACHQGDHHPYLEEWAASPHAVMSYTTDPAEDPAHIVESTVATGSDCQGCHTGEFALRKDMSDPTGIGFRANAKYGYREATHTPKANDFMRLTCVVCHDSHGNGNPAQLRFKVSVADTLQNLCIRCHGRRAVPAASWRGPHSPEGQLTLGLNAGWRPPGMAPLPTQIAGTHASPTANRNGCATCHMPTAPTNGVATTGHLFLAIPCMDAKGRPTNAEDCALAQRSFAACAGSGCHATDAIARGLTSTSTLRVTQLMEELKALLENTAKVPCAEFNPTTPITIARGARFNYLMAAGHGHQENDACTAGAPAGNELRRALPKAEADLGGAIHNPAYLEQLLRGSLAAVRATYYK